MDVKNMTIQKIATNLISSMLSEEVKLEMVEITNNEKTVVINRRVYMDISTIDKDYYSTGVINGKEYTSSVDEDFDKVIELLKENS